jgi:hypothetical protein
MIGLAQVVDMIANPRGAFFLTPQRGEPRPDGMAGARPEPADLALVCWEAMIGR